MRLESIGKNIRKYRQQKKLRQEDLAEKTGLSTNYIGAVERGEKIPSLETLIEIINVLEISADLVLADVVSTGYMVRTSLLSEKLETVSDADRQRIFAVIDTLLRYTQ